MAKEGNLNKNLYKGLLISLKIFPILTSIGYLTHTILSYFNVDIPVFSHLFGISLLPWLFILLATIIFKFCSYHRMFLYYILTVNIISIVDYYIGIPISDFKLLTLYLIIAGIFLFLSLYLYVRHHKNSNKINT